MDKKIVTAIFMIQKGDKFALPGMIMGLEALGVLVMYLLLVSLLRLISALPSSPSTEQLQLMIVSLLPFIYISAISGIIPGVILSIIGLKINRAKMGKLGLIFSAGALVLLLLLVFVIIPRFLP